MQDNPLIWLFWSTADYALCGALTLLFVSYTHEGLKSSFKNCAKRITNKPTTILATRHDMRDMIWTLDGDLNLTYVNPMVELPRSYSADETMKLGLAGRILSEALDRGKEMLNVELKNESEDLKR